MDADYPITKCCDDRLGRTHLALHVADMLRAAPAAHSIVFGLSGSWGSGKTSVLNMVRELLGKDDDPPVVVRFNPWNYPVGTDLVRPFLNLLASEIRNARSGEAAKKLAEDAVEAIGDYANALDPIIPPQLGVLGSLARIFSTRRKKALSQKTPEELKRQLADKLLLLHLRIVVMIDDLDRLPNEMVCAVFQLVAAVADFPRVSYLLAYDRSNVVRALHEVQKCDGDEYLEKIVQVPLELPQPSIGALSAMVEEGIGKILSGVRLDDGEWRRVGSAVSGAALRANTVRDVRRILNVFEADWAASQEKISPGDLLDISVLRIVYPQIMSWIRARNSQLSGGASGGYLNSDAEKRKEQYLDELDQWLGGQSKAEGALWLLGNIFPRFANTCGLRAVQVSEAQLKLDRRIACPEILESYLLGAMEAYAFPREEALILLSSGTVDELAEFLERDENDVTLTLITVAGDTAADMSDARRSAFARALIRSGSGKVEHVGKFALPIDRCEWCLEKLFAAMGKEAASELFATELQGLDFAHMAKLARFINDQELAYGRLAANRENPNDQLISLSCLKQVEQSVLQALSATELTINDLQVDSARILLYLWNCFDPEAYEERVTNGLLRDPLAYLLFASYQLGRYHSGNGGGWAPPDAFTDDVDPKRVIASFDAVLRADAFWLLDPNTKTKLAGLKICTEKMLNGGVSHFETEASDEQCAELLLEWASQRTGA